MDERASRMAAARLLPVLLSLGAAGALAAPPAYVANEKSGTVSVLDSQTDEVLAEIPVGSKPRGMALSLDGKRLYVSVQDRDALLMVDTEARKVAGTIALGKSPEGVSISADGRLLAAASELANAV